MRVMKPAAVVASIAIGSALLAACSQTSSPGAVQSRLPVYAVDLTGGAKNCTVSDVTPAAGKTVQATMQVGNDGGWCAVLAHQDGPKPYEAGLLTKRPAHGTITIHSVGDNTRIDYVPDPGYAGADTFGVTLVPGSAVVQVNVTVSR